MDIQIVNPLETPNWDDLVLATGKASFFHSSGWARVLHESYGYKPIYFASFDGSRLLSLMPFMEINSWLTGKRGVSLPFTDQCPAIVSDEGLFQTAVKDVIDYGQRAGWKYIEWRDGSLFPQEVTASESHYTHELNLIKSEKELFSGLRDSTRRNIKKAAKAGVSVQISRSLDSIKSFYGLNCITRKHHGLPPQPISYFNKVFVHVLSKGHGIVVSAVHSGNVIASSVFFHFGKKAIFKHGASDLAHLDLRPNNLVMWEAIRYYRDEGFKTLNFGRTETINLGLLQYKRGWGAVESLLKYYRFDCKKKVFVADLSRVLGLQKRLFAQFPVAMLRLVGSLFYRHVG